MVYCKGKLRADKVEYKDGIGCCIWYPFPEPGLLEPTEVTPVPNLDTQSSEDSGICFDFSYSDIDDMIELLQYIKKVNPTKYKTDDYVLGIDVARREEGE